jgi:hypothetical protein
MEEIDVNTYTTRLRLHLRLSSSADEGGYKCCSKNSIGDSEGTITVYGKSSSSYCYPIPADVEYFLCIFSPLAQPPKEWRRKNRWGDGRITTKKLARSRTLSTTPTIRHWK